MVLSFSCSGGSSALLPGSKSTDSSFSELTPSSLPSARKGAVTSLVSTLTMAFQMILP